MEILVIGRRADGIFPRFGAVLATLTVDLTLIQQFHPMEVEGVIRRYPKLAMHSSVILRMARQ